MGMISFILLCWILAELEAPIWCYVLLFAGVTLRIVHDLLEE